jgi:predicted transposase/invertase (TIGR01784 family)
MASEENKDILAGLIHDFFQLKINAEDITIKNPYSIKAYKELIADSEHSIMKLRQTLKDVGASLSSLDLTAEVQVNKDDFFGERTVYYTFDLYCGNLNKQDSMKLDAKGDLIRYSSLRPVYSLNILKYNHFIEDDDAFRNFLLYDPERNKAFDDGYVRIAFFELNKSHVETQNQQYWKEYFLGNEPPDRAPEYIKKAARIIDYQNLKEEEKHMLSLMEKAQMERESELYTSWNDGKKEGIMEGKKEGIVEERLRTIQNLKAMDMDISTIAQAMGLSAEDVLQLEEVLAETGKNIDPRP